MSEPKKFERMAVAAPSGGYRYLGMTEEDAQIQRKAIWDMLSSIGKNVVNKQNLTNVSLPVTVFEPRSYLQRLIDAWWAAPTFLKLAAETDDPVKRFKLVITFAVAGFHNTCAQLKPFNPILGETHQASFADGTQIYCEQSSHHPPVTNFLVVGPNDSYKFYGYGEWHASFRGNTVKGHQRGPHFVEFPDGTLITYSLPWMNVHGILYGDRVVEYDGTLDFRDEKNGLTCDLEINPKEEGSFWSGWFSKNKLPTDYLKGQIVKVNKGSASSLNLSTLKKKGTLPDGCEILCDVQGSWLGCIEFGDERLWDFQENYTVHEPVPTKTPLPSDCRFRDDINALAEGDREKSQQEKIRLEEKQRREAKLRKEGEEILKQRAKKKGKKKSKKVKEPRILKRPGSK